MNFSRMVQSSKRQILSVLSAFDSSDIPFLLVALALSLVGYGFSQIHRGVGPIVVGGLTLLYVRPFLRWLK